MREGEVMTTGSEGRSSADVALSWKKVMKTVGSAGYVSNNRLSALTASSSISRDV